MRIATNAGVREVDERLHCTGCVNLSSLDTLPQCGHDLEVHEMWRVDVAVGADPLAREVAVRSVIDQCGSEHARVNDDQR